ncbi:MAG: glycoside hydrolase 5 family protein [Bacillota bacterium]
MGRRLVAAMLVAALLLASGCAPRPAEEAASAFVTVKEGKFWLNGKPFRFAGNNTYYLALSQRPEDEANVDRILQANKEKGVRVMRIWAFWDGDSRGFQPRLGEYNEKAFGRLDLVLQKAAEYDIRLILVFTNNWKDYGGMDKYVQWVGAEKHEDFYTHPQIVEAYKNYIRHMVTRVNTLTGVPYKDDPTIMAWELANEPRAQADKSGETIFRWASEISALIKSLDANHLVAIGDEGWFKRSSGDWAYNGNEGVDWDRNLTIPTVDFAVFHMWIEHWKKDLAWSDRWIKDHVETARKAGKPVVLEEYGAFAKPAERDVWFARWYKSMEEAKIDGSMAWMMSEKEHDDNHPGFTHTGSTARLLAEHAARMK